jgi:hypothetical protein
MNLSTKEIKAVYLKYFGLNLAAIFILVSLVDISFFRSYFFIAFILIGMNDLKNSINRIRIHTEVNLEKLPSGVSLLVAQLMVITTARYYLSIGLPNVGFIALIAVIIYIVSSFIDSKYKERMKLNEV